MADLSSFFEQHYLRVVLAGRSPATVADMRSFVSVWDKSMGPLDLREIDLPTASNYLRSLLKDHSAATANKHRSYLLAMLREARREKLVRGGWFKRLRKLPEEQKLPEAWDRAQVERVLAEAAKQPGEMVGVPLCDWWRAFMLVLVNTGVRRKAGLSILTADVDLERRLLVVRATGQKTRKDQCFAVSERTADAIQAIYVPTRIALFPWFACQATLGRHFKRICQRAGVPCGGHSGVCHRARSTAITHAWAVSPDAARQMAGHPSLKTTQEHYVDPRVLAELAPLPIKLF